MQAQVVALNSSLGIGTLDPKLSASLKSATNDFSNALTASGAFTKQTVQLTSETTKFGQALESGKLSLGQYYQIVTGKSGAATNSVKQLALEQTKLQNSVIMADPTKQGFYSVFTPTTIDAAANATKIAANEANIYALAVQKGSQSLINFGKNTQWAGRQLTVGLGMPMLLFGSEAVKSFESTNAALTQLQKVYGEGLTPPSQDQIDKISQQVLNLGKTMAQTTGISQEFTIQVASTFAAMGKMGTDLTNATEQTVRLAKLGNLDQTTATNAMIALQNVYKLNTTQTADAVNYFAAIQKQTSLSMNDLITSESKVGPIIDQLGGSYKDTSIMLLAMKEAGVPAAQAANALKSGFASIIAPTAAANKEFASFGINLSAIKNAGGPVQMIEELQSGLNKLSPLVREQLIEKLFGKFQFSRMSALLANFNAVGSQTANAIKIAGASSSALADLANQEMAQATKSPSAQWQIALNTFKADLYPVGQMIMKIGADVLQFANGVAKAFGGLPGPVKMILAVLAGFVALSGPVIMLTGLFANFAGNVLKGVFNLKQLVTGGKTLGQLLTPELIAAQNASDLFSKGVMGDADAIKLLNEQIVILTDNLTNLVDRMGAGAGLPQITDDLKISTAAVLTTESGIAEQLALPGFASGGIIKGPGNGTSDSIVAMVSNGEAIVPADKTKKYGPLISAIINGVVPAYSDGSEEINASEENERIRSAQRAYYGGHYNYLSKSGKLVTATDREFAHFDAPVGPERISNSKGAMYNREINQGTNSGTLSVQNMLDYLSGKKLTVGNGGDIKPGQKIVDANGNEAIRTIQHDQEKAYGHMATTAGINDPEQRQKFFDDLDENFKKWLNSLPTGAKLKDNANKPGTYSATEQGKIFNQTLSSGKYGQSSTALSDLEMESERRTTGKGRSGSTREFNPDNTTFSGTVAKIQAGKDLNSQQRESFKNLGKKISDTTAEGMADGIKSGQSKVDEALNSVINSSVKQGQETIQSHSPSELFATKLGKPSIDGVAKGMEDAAPAMWTKGKTIISTAVDEMNTAAKESSLGSVGSGLVDEVEGGLESEAGGGLLSKAGGLLTKEGGGMSMMGKMGASMAGMMASQAIGNMLPKGSNVSNIFNSTASMASTGMMFGPWGAAAGAAIGLVTSGIGALMKAEKEHQQVVKATFTASSSDIAMFGDKAYDANAKMNSFVISTTKAGTTIKSTLTPAVQGYVNAIKGLSSSDPDAIFTKSIAKMTKTADVIKAVQTKVAAAVASGMDPEHAKDYTEALLVAANQTTKFGDVWSAIGPKVSSTSEATTTQFNALSDAINNASDYVDAGAVGYKDLGNAQKDAADQLHSLFVAAGTGQMTMKQLNDAVNGLKNSSMPATDQINLLEDAILHSGNQDEITNFQHIQKVWKDAGDQASLTAGQVMQMTAAMSMGVTDSTVTAWAKTQKNLKGASLATDYQNYLNSPAYASLQKQVDATQAKQQANELEAQKKEEIAAGLLPGGGGSSSTAVFSGTVAQKQLEKTLQGQLDAQNAQLKIAQQQLTIQNKVSAEMKRQMQYQQQITGLQNDMKTAMISGNYLEAASLKQQISGAQVDFNSTTVQQKMQDQVDALQGNADQFNTALQNLKDAIGNGSSVIDKTISAIAKLPVLQNNSVVSGVGGATVNTVINVTGAVNSVNSTTNHPLAKASTKINTNGTKTLASRTTTTSFGKGNK